MDDAQKKIVKDVFYGLREMERNAQRLIKKLTAFDKMAKGVYQPKTKEVPAVNTVSPSPEIKTEVPTVVDTPNTGK